MGTKKKNPGRVPGFKLVGPFIKLSTFWGTDHLEAFFYSQVSFN